MSRRDLQNRRALVTGASSGIGRAIAVELARRGAQVVGLARRGDRLSELEHELGSNGRAFTGVAGDVTDPAARSAALERARESYGGLDLVVNCAGIGALGPFDQSDPSLSRRVMEVNFFAAVDLTRAALPMLRRGVQPAIVNISSVLGLRAVPRASFYCASKFALEGWSQSLRAELAGEKIDVIVICPSTTETEFFDAVVERHGQDRWSDRPRMSAATVARHTARAIERGRQRVVLSAGGKALALGARLAPNLMDRIVAKYF